VADPASAVIGALALIVSIWALVASRNTSRAQNALQERLLTLETARERVRISKQERADLRGSIVKGSGHAYQLQIVNHGAAQARNVEVLVDGKTLAEDRRVMVRANEEARTLGPGAFARYGLIITSGTEAVFDVRIRWEDDTSEVGSWHSQLRWH
jgi:hypothetical protein